MWIGIGLGLAVGCGPGGGSAQVALDPPIASALAAKTVAAWGFDRVVEGFSGNTIVAKNNDLGTTASYGFDGSGRFSGALPANSDLVSFADQKGGSITLSAYAGSTTLALTRAGVAKRFGTTMSTVDGQLTRSTTDGGIGVDLAGVGMLQTSAALTGMTPSLKGYEIHILRSPNNRTIASNDSTDPVAGGTNTRENIICYGLNSNNQMIAYVGGGASTDFCRMQSGGQQNQTTGKGPYGTFRHKANAQVVTSYAFSPTAFAEYENGKKSKALSAAGTPVNAATTTAMQGGSMDNGVIGVGGVFSSTTLTTLGTTNRGSMLVSQVIVTEALTDAERFMLHAKMSACGQQHRVKAKADIEAMFDELIDMRDINVSTGRVVGKNGLLTVDFNLTGGSTFQTAYTAPDVGLTGIRSPDNNTANSFQATTNWFYENNTGTVMRLGFLESGAQNGNLQFDFNMAAGNPQTDNRGDASLMFGFHHQVPSLGTKLAASLDTLPRLGSRLQANLSAFGPTPYDGINQTIGKYNYFASACIGMAYGEEIPAASGKFMTKGVWEKTNPTEMAAAYTLDAPVINPTPDLCQYPFKPSQLQLHIGTFEPPAGWNPASPDTSLFLQGKSKNFVSGGAVQPIGHMDGSYGASVYTGVRQGDTGHKIQSNPYQYQWMGSRYLWGFRKGYAFTWDDAETIQVNAYKLAA